MRLIKPDGISASNLLISSLPYAVVMLCLFDFVKNYHIIKDRTNKYVFFLFQVLFFVNFINIFRGIFDSDSYFFTSVANSYNALALLTPLFFSYGVNKVNLSLFNNLLFRMLVLSLFLFLFAISLNNAGLSSSLLSLMQSSIFLICATPFLSGLKKLTIILFCQVEQC